jgi:hypothetical protein
VLHAKQSLERHYITETASNASKDGVNYEEVSFLPRKATGNLLHTVDAYEGPARRSSASVVLHNRYG